MKKCINFTPLWHRVILKRWGALLSDDLVWYQPGKGSLSGVYRGKQNIFAHLGRMAQLSNGTFAIDQVDYVTENGDLVVAAIRFAVSASGHSMEMKGVGLFRFENGLIKEVWLFSERIDEEDRFGRHWHKDDYLSNPLKQAVK